MMLSVVIPTCDRPDKLRECLRRVMSQAAGSYEVIVSDDSGTVKTPEILDGVRWMQGPRQGPAANRNCGAKQARGEWLVFLDDDCLPEAGWLAAFEEVARNEPAADVMEGRTECPLEDQFAFYDIVENLTGNLFWSCNLAIRRQIFEEMGGFDVDFTTACAEDVEFAWRMRKRGLRSVFVEKARVTHPPRRMTLPDLFRRTASHRWMLLCQLKTGQGPRLDCNWVHVISALVVKEYLNSLRMAYHLRRKADRMRIKGRMLDVLWRWISVTAFLPYYCFWEIRWREILVERSKRG